MNSNSYNDGNSNENTKFNDTNNKSNNTNNSTNDSNSISETSLPSFNKVLVTHDGKDKSDKAINYSIYFSNISGSEITILQIVESIDKLENTSVNVTNAQTNDTSSSSTDNQYYSLDVKSKIVDSMEKKIKAIENAGFKNKVSYKIKTGTVTGKVADEIVSEIKESHYDLVILSSSNLDSWFKSIFSDSRKIISSISIPVLIVQ